MGALTFKFKAYQTRPWELTLVQVPDYIDQLEGLTYHYRGIQLQQITGHTWLRDRVRFSYDGFRRQRLTFPLLNNQPATWSSLLAFWFDLVYQRPVFLLVDPVQPRIGWLVLLLSRLSFLTFRLPTTDCVVYAVDVNQANTIYQGSYGLQAVNRSSVVIPTLLPHEEDLKVQLNGVTQTEHFSLLVTQVVSNFTRNYRYRSISPPVINFNSNRYACFQVSPVQKFLTT